MAQRDDSTAEPMIARDATYYRAPDAMRACIRASLAAETRGERRAGISRIFGFGMSFATVAVLAWMVGFYYAKPSDQEGIARDVVVAHVRSLLAENHLNDAASTDH